MVEIIEGDCVEVMRGLAPDSIHCCITSPPYYGLRDYGVAGQIGRETTPSEYVAALVRAFREVRRVLRPDGTLWLNLGDSYGGTRGNKSPAPDNKHPHAEADTPGDAKRGTSRKRLLMMPHRVALALQEDGWWVRSDIVWSKPNAMTESVTDRPTKTHEYLFLLAKSGKYYYNADAVREPSQSGNPPGRNRRSVWTINTSPYKGHTSRCSHPASWSLAFWPDALLTEPCSTPSRDREQWARSRCDWDERQR